MCTYSDWPSWICLCSSARMSDSWELHCVMKWRTKSPAPLVNIPEEAEERPSDWKHDISDDKLESLNYVSLFYLKLQIRVSLGRIKGVNTRRAELHWIFKNCLNCGMFKLSTSQVLTSAPDAIASTDQPCSGTNSREAFRIRTWSCSSVSYSSPCSPLWSW